MKKLFLVLAVASLGFVSCNNEAADTEAEAKRVADSTHTADSIKAAEAAAAVPTPADLEAQRVADSTRVADSIKAATKK
jgi:hypothetical protein